MHAELTLLAVVSHASGHIISIQGFVLLSWPAAHRVSFRLYLWEVKEKRSFLCFQCTQTLCSNMSGCLYVASAAVYRGCWHVLCFCFCRAWALYETKDQNRTQWLNPCNKCPQIEWVSHSCVSALTNPWHHQGRCNRSNKHRKTITFCFFFSPKHFVETLPTARWRKDREPDVSLFWTMPTAALVSMWAANNAPTEVGRVVNV